MKLMPHYSTFQEIEEQPEKPFLEDLRKDLKKINEYYNQKDGKQIKKKLITEILNDL